MALLNAMGSALSGLTAQQVRLDVVGDNLANASTSGFREARVDFESALSETIRLGTEPQGGTLGGSDPLQAGLGVNVARISRDFEAQGTIIATGRPEDLAVDGAGFFILEGGAYTRDGSFARGADGVLRTSGGLAVQGLNADPTTFVMPASGPLENVTIPLGTLELAPGNPLTGFSVGADGTVTGTFLGGELRTIAQIRLARFANPNGLEAAGNNLFREALNSGGAIEGAPGSRGLGTLAGGALEASVVDFAEQFGELIAAQRAFQANARVLARAEQALEDLVKLL